MPPEPSRIRNGYAFRWLVLIVGLLFLAGWLLARAHEPDADPPIVALIAIGIGALILFDEPSA